MGIHALGYRDYGSIQQVMIVVVEQGFFIGW